MARTTTTALVVGAVVLLVARLRLQVGKLLHYARFPVDYDAVRREGVLAVARRRPLVPYGFDRPSRWTGDAPRCPYAKTDAMPVDVIELLTRHDPITGVRLGTSVFIEGGEAETRSVRKNMYRRGVDDAAVEEYRSTVARLGPLDVSCHDAALRHAASITWRIHFGRAPRAEELRDTVEMCHAITRALNGDVFASVEGAKARVHAAVVGAREGMLGRWRKAGLSTEDRYVELAHNLFGMTIQWCFLLVRMARTGTAGFATLESAAAFVLDDPPAKVAASRVDGALVLHDLEARCRRARRPVVFDPSPPTAETVGSPDDEHYAPFGAGARRCPGEWLTYVFLTAVTVRASASSWSSIPPKLLGVAHV